VALIGSALVLWIMPALGVQVLKKYQNDRLTGFIHPSYNPQGATYNVAQSKVALGAGGLHGAGSSAPRRPRSASCPRTTPISSSPRSASSTASSATSILLGLYLFVVWRGLRVLVNARDGYQAVVVGGIVAMLVFQVFVNVGMTMGIAPITGIPLPLVSVGGSSLFANLAAFGVLIGMQMRGERSRRGLR